MFKLKGKVMIDAREFAEAFDQVAKTAAAKTAAKTLSSAKKVASLKLRSGLKHWNKGISIEQLGEGKFAIVLSGKLATMMEDGFTGKDLKRMILNGNRAKYNKSKGKDYVDVPIGLDAQTLVKDPDLHFNMQLMKSSDDLAKAFGKSITGPKSKSVKFSKWKTEGVRTEKRIIRRLEDLIESTKNTKKKSIVSYLTIKRVTPDGKAFENANWEGAKVLESRMLEAMISKAFEDALRKAL